MNITKHFSVAVGALFFGYAIAIFVYGYVAAEHPAYLWDWGGYFRLYQTFGNLISTDPWSWLKQLANSVYSDDYNASSIAILFPFYDIFGSGRTGYILGIVSFFLVPAALVSALLSIYSTRNSDPIQLDIVAIAVVVASVLFPPFWQAALRGMPDIAGLIPLGAATWLILRSDFLSRQTVRTALAVGVLIWSAFLLRRWYAYSCIALLLCAFAFATTRAAFGKKDRNEKLRKVAISFLIIGIVATALLFIFQAKLAFRILTTSYGDLYVGYQMPLLDQIWTLYQRVGLFYVTAFVVGLILAIAQRSIPILFMAVTGILTYLLFSKTQAPAVQHGLPLYLWGLPVALFGIQKALLNIPSILRQMAAVSGILLSISIFATALLPVPNALMPAIATIAPRQTYFPLRVENYAEYQRLILKLQELTAGGDQFAVFASSEILSDSLLEALDQSLNTKISWSSQVDERDGLRLQALRAKYAVVADPVPLHLPEASQRVITVPASHILHSSGFGISYSKLSGPYMIAGGRRAYIFMRNEPLTRSQILGLEEEMSGFHANWSWDGTDLIFTNP